MALAVTVILSLAGSAAQAQSATAATTTQPPTIASAFTPTTVGVGQTAAIGFTVTDPNASGSFTNLAFTDTLGGGAVIDNPTGLATSGCGSAIAVTANPGDTTITVAAATVKAGTPCTISVDVTSSTAGTVTSQTSTVTSSGPTSSAGSAATLTVLAAPTVTVTSPAVNATYAFGQKVTATYTCTDAVAGDLQGCTAQDDLGHTVASGGLLETSVPGQHQLTVQAFAATGLVTDQTINYTVLPDNVFTLKALSHTASKVGFTLKLPGAGKVKVTAWSGSKKLATLTVSVTAAKSVKVNLPISGTPGKVKVVIAYTPTGGVVKKLTKHVSLG